MPEQLVDLKMGQASANEIVQEWHNFDSASRDRAKDHIRYVLKLALESIDKYQRLSLFTIGYFEAIRKRNDPELNIVIEPLVKNTLYKFRKETIPDE